LARAYDNAGDYVAAIASLKYYLLASPQADDSHQVRAEIGDLERRQLNARQAAEEQRRLALLQKQQEATLRAFRGCWYTDDTPGVVDSVAQTGSLGPQTTVAPGSLRLCWLVNLQGQTYFVAPGNGYAYLTAAMLQIGVVSQSDNWSVLEVNTETHDIELEVLATSHYNTGNEQESEVVYTCTLEPPEIECRMNETANWNHQPWFTRTSHFRMARLPGT